MAAQDLEGAVLRHIGAHQVDPQLYLGAGPLLDAVQWSAQVFTYFKSADQHTQVAVSEAFAAIAETGTVVLCSGPSTPTSHNFLPEDHIVVVDSTRIVRHQEDVWPLLRNREVLPSGRSTSLQALQKPVTSSRPSSMAPTDRGACTY